MFCLVIFADDGANNIGVIASNQEMDFYMVNTDDWSDQQNETSVSFLGNISTLGKSLDQANYWTGSNCCIYITESKALNLVDSHTEAHK